MEALLGMEVISSSMFISAVVATAVWMNKYYGGFAWDGSHQQFNVHPMCMVVGLVLLYGTGKMRRL